MPLVSAYSAMLGGGSAIMLIPTAAFESIVFMHHRFLLGGHLQLDVAIGANGVVPRRVELRELGAGLRCGRRDCLQSLSEQLSTPRLSSCRGSLDAADRRLS